MLFYWISTEIQYQGIGFAIQDAQKMRQGAQSQATRRSRSYYASILRVEFESRIRILDSNPGLEV